MIVEKAFVSETKILSEVSRIYKIMLRVNLNGNNIKMYLKNKHYDNI